MISALVDLAVVAVVLASVVVAVVVPAVSATVVTAAMVGLAALALVEGSFLFPPFLTYMPYFFFLFLFCGTLHSFLGHPYHYW